jgi:hypothetical protein
VTDEEQRSLCANELGNARIPTFDRPVARRPVSAYVASVAHEPDPLLASLKELIAVADEASFCADQRNYAKTRELRERLKRVSTVACLYRAANKTTRPNKTYRWIEGLSPTVAACLLEMDSVQSAADASVLARLDDTRARAASFAIAKERCGLSGAVSSIGAACATSGVIECEDCLKTQAVNRFADCQPMLHALGWTLTAHGQRCSRCSGMTDPPGLRSQIH